MYFVSIKLEHSNPRISPVLALIQKTGNPVPSCADARSDSRTCHLAKGEEEQLKKLTEIAQLPEVERLKVLFMDGYESAGLVGKARSRLFGKHDRC